jgi:hypothetical protein
VPTRFQLLHYAYSHFIVQPVSRNTAVRAKDLVNQRMAQRSEASLNDQSQNTPASTDAAPTTTEEPSLSSLTWYDRQLVPPTTADSSDQAAAVAALAEDLFASTVRAPFTDRHWVSKHANLVVFVCILSRL